jgi:transposase, IS6 family
MTTRRPHPAPIASSAFAGFRFPSDVIVLAVRWYLRFGLSYRDVEELLTEREVEVDHVTIYRWVLRFTPLLADAARPCRHAVGSRGTVALRPTALSRPCGVEVHPYFEALRTAPTRRI